MANAKFTSYVKADNELWCTATLTVTEKSYDVAKNTSIVQYSFSGTQRNDGFEFWGTTRNPAGTIIVNINGTDVKSANIALINTSKGHGTCSGSGTVTISHNSDGKKTINFSIRMKEVGGNYQGDKWIYQSKSANGSLKLTDIPRTSDFSINAGSAQLGSAVSVSISRPSSNFTHEVKYKYGNSEYTVAASAAATSASFTPPLSLASQYPNSTSGTLTVTVTTKNGSTVIGSKNKTVNLNIPSSVVPTMGNPTATRVNNGIPASWGIYVQGYSKATIKINSAAGVYGSTIKSYSIIGPGLNTTSSSGTTSALTTVGTNTYTCTITDSRGRSATKTVPISVVGYSTPSVIVTAERCDSSGAETPDGTYLKVIVDWSINSVSGKNAVASREVSCNGVSNTSFADNTAFVLAANVDVKNSYYLLATIEDSLGKTAVASINIPTSTRIMNVKQNKRGLAIGKFSEQDDTFEVGWSTTFYKGVGIRGTTYLGGDIKTELDTQMTLMGPLNANMGINLGGSNQIEAPHSGGQWIKGRETARLYNPKVNSGLFKGLISSKTLNGSWTIGTLDDWLVLNYEKDSDYNSGNNVSTKVEIDSSANIKTTGKIISTNQLYTTGYLGVEGTSSFIGNASFANHIYSHNQYINYGSDSNCTLAIEVQTGSDGTRTGVMCPRTPQDGKWGNRMIMFREYKSGFNTVFRPEANGGAYLGSTNYRWNTIWSTNSFNGSDLKEKRIIKDFDINNYAKFIMGLRPIAFNRTTDSDTGNRIHLGFGAQDVDKLIREIGMGDMSMVQAAYLPQPGGITEIPYHGEKLSLEDDKKLTWSLNYTEIIAPMVYVIQQQEKRIKKLENILKQERCDLRCENYM